MSSGRSKLRNVSLLRLLYGFGLLNLSEWGFIAALSVAAYRAGGTLDVGLLGVRFVAGALSSAVLSPLLANRRGVLSVIAFLRAGLLGCAAALAIGGGSFLLVLLFVVVDAIVAAAYRPAQSRLMPSLARSPDELTGAVAGTSLAKTMGRPQARSSAAPPLTSSHPGRRWPARRSSCCWRWRARSGSVAHRYRRHRGRCLNG